jgi:Ca2+-binding EF-hand superfamily protein
VVSIEELLAAIQKIQGVSDEAKEEKIRKVLLSLDRDRDGKIDDMSNVVKVFELISEENVKVTKDQLTIILNLLEKEKLLELEEEQKKLQKQ